MASIKSKDTEPELLVRQALWKRGLRYRVNVRTLPGKPDIVFTRAKIAIFCDGDFWHGHNWAVRGMASLEEELNSYSEFWRSKILSNIERDSKNTLALTESGWIVIRLWESDMVLKNPLTAKPCPVIFFHGSNLFFAHPCITILNF